MNLRKNLDTTHLQATHDYIVRIAADNLKRYRAGDPLENIVDLMTGYKA